jgi:hypothetical protein
MDILLIIVGVLLAIPLLLLALTYIGWAIYWNLIDHLIYPAIVLAGATGIFLILHGTHLCLIR